MNYSARALLCLMMLAVICPALAADLPSFEPPLTKGGLPANVLVLKPKAALPAGEGMKAGSYHIWMAEKVDKPGYAAWKWQKAGPCAFKGGSRYRVAIIAPNRLSLKDITGTDPLAVGLNEISINFENTLAVPMALVVAAVPDIAAPPDSSSPSKSLPVETSISGLYDCGLGKMKLSRKGKIVSGAYDWSGGGTICGSMEGNVLTGTFADKYGSGEIRYTFDTAGFQNNWRFTGETIWREHPRAKKVK